MPEIWKISCCNLVPHTYSLKAVFSELFKNQGLGELITSLKNRFR